MRIIKGPALRFALCLLHSAFCAVLLADTGWSLTTADFKRQSVSLQAITAEAVQVAPPGAPAVSIPMEQFLQLDRTRAAQAAGGSFLLVLANGDRIGGSPTGFENEQVAWSSPSVGPMKLSLKSLRALVRAGQNPDGLDQPRTDDLVALTNGDTARGIITDIGDKGIRLSGAAEIEIPMESVKWIHFAVAVHPAAPPRRAFRVRLADGSILTVDHVTANAEKITVDVPGGGRRDLALASVVGIEQLNGPVSWLSSRTPLRVVQTPYFGDQTWPARMDQTVGGKPLQFGSQIFARGIGVHAYSRLDYPLDGSYSAFRTQYAIAEDDRRQFADVTVRIWVDDRVVHEQANVKAGVLSPVVAVPLPPGAKVLSLEVDYGQANDTQDRFNWIEPALVR